jgi:outer membrane protein insertion porin family
LESTRGSYTTVEGGVAASILAPKPTSAGCWSRTPPITRFFRNRSTGQGFVFARSTTVGVENPLGSTVLLDPAQTPTAGETLIPLPERFYSGGGNSNRGFGLNQAGPRDPFTGYPVGGSAVFLNNLEMRFPNVSVPYLNDNIGFTLFEDMGNVFARPQEMLPSLGRFHQPNRQFVFRSRTHSAVQLQLRFARRRHWRALSDADRPIAFDFGYNLNPPYFPSYTNYDQRRGSDPLGSRSGSLDTNAPGILIFRSA